MRTIEGTKLKAVRESKGISRPSLADKMGWQYDSMVYQLERNLKDGSLKMAQKLAQKLGVSTYRILSDEFLQSVNEGRAQYKIDSGIPIVGKVAAGTRDALAYTDGDMPPGVGIYGNITLNAVGKRTYAVLVEGESMIPSFFPGEILVIDPDRPFTSGNHYIIRASDESVWVKRIVKKGDQYLLLPDNPKIEPIILKEDEVEFIHRIVCTWH